jgi:integrase
VPDANAGWAWVLAVSITLRDARTRANGCQQKLWDGIDPITVAHEERAARARESASLKTFREASNLFYDQHHTKWTSATYRGAFHQRLNKYVHPKLGSLPVARISKPLIIETLTPIWNEKNSTAIKCLGLIENVLDFAKVAGWRDGENPAVWKGNLQYAFPSLRNHEHHEALPFAEISEFMKKLRKVKTIAARCLEFTILTAVRRDEARLAQWSEINFETKRWTIPAARMKMKKDHVLPLSPQAIALLKALPREHSPWIFIDSCSFCAAVISPVRIVKAPTSYLRSILRGGVVRSFLFMGKVEKRLGQLN